MAAQSKQARRSPNNRIIKVGNIELITSNFDSSYVSNETPSHSIQKNLTRLPFHINTRTNFKGGLPSDLAGDNTSNLYSPPYVKISSPMLDTNEQCVELSEVKTPKSMCSVESESESDIDVSTEESDVVLNYQESMSQLGNCKVSQTIMSSFEDSRLDQIRSVIREQFDFEILLKHREAQNIDNLINKVKAMMLKIEKHTEAKNKGILIEPTQTPSPPVMDSMAEDSHNTGYIPMKTRSQTLTLRPNRLYQSAIHCICRRRDGLLVKMQCLYCGRSNFNGVQGFINHNRLAHGKEYSCHDIALETCGIILEDQDAEGLNIMKANNLTLEDIRKINERLSGSSIAPDDVSHFFGQSSTYIPRRFANKRSLSDTIHTTINLKQLINKKQKFNNNESFDALVKTTVEKVEKSYLFENEEEEEIGPEGSEHRNSTSVKPDATPFERAIAEARKLNIDVEKELALGSDKSIKKQKGRNRRKSKAGGFRPKGSIMSHARTQSTTSSDSLDADYKEHRPLKIILPKVHRKRDVCKDQDNDSTGIGFHITRSRSRIIGQEES